VKEIKRVLKCNGYLIARVNSVNDINYGARSGDEKEAWEFVVIKL